MTGLADGVGVRAEGDIRNELATPRVTRHKRLIVARTIGQLHSGIQGRQRTTHEEVHVVGILRDTRKRNREKGSKQSEAMLDRKCEQVFHDL